MKRVFLSILMFVSLCFVVGCGQQCPYGYSNYNNQCIPTTGVTSPYGYGTPTGNNYGYGAGYSGYSGYNGYPQH
jgi:hypothetical protein